MYKIICKHVYEIGKTQRFRILKKKNTKIPEDIEKIYYYYYYYFDILGFIRTF